MLVAPALALGLAACAGSRSGNAHRESDESVEVEYLIRGGTSDSLATASLLAHLTQGPDDSPTGGGVTGPEPADLIERAVALGGTRAELVWLQLRDCQQRHCADELRLAERLQTLDPGNGLAWLPDLKAGQAAGPAAVTAVIDRMGAAPTPTIYWNKLTVVMFDALTHRDKSQPPTAITRAAADRLAHVTGVLSAVNVPAFQVLAHACRLDQFDLPGRRVACETLMNRLATADALITQDLSLSLRESWWPVGSAEHEVLRKEHLQHRYLAAASELQPGLDPNRAAQMRIDAMRRLEREDEVDRSLLAAFHAPVERPADWPGSAAAE